MKVRVSWAWWVVWLERCVHLQWSLLRWGRVPGVVQGKSRVLNGSEGLLMELVRGAEREVELVARVAGISSGLHVSCYSSGQLARSSFNFLSRILRRKAQKNITGLDTWIFVFFLLGLFFFLYIFFFLIIFFFSFFFSFSFQGVLIFFPFYLLFFYSFVYFTSFHSHPLSPFPIFFSTIVEGWGTNWDIFCAVEYYGKRVYWWGG